MTMVAARQGMRVLVTGGAGFVGSHLTGALLDQGAGVIVLDDFSTGRRENLAHLLGRADLRVVEGSVADHRVLDPLVDSSDVVFHLAAAVGVELILRDPVRVLESNILGAQAVLHSASDRGVRVLFASTSEIYGKSERVPFREEDDRILGPTSNARWSYSTSKAVGEYLALAYHHQKRLPVTIFRMFNTIGTRQTGRYGMVVPRLVEQALRRQPLTVYGDGRQTRSFCDVRDAVRAILELAWCSAAVGEVVNVGSTDEITILELAERILGLVDQRLGRPTEEPGTSGLEQGRIVLVPYAEAYEPGFEDMRRRVPLVEKQRRLTGWEPRISLDETLSVIIEEMAAGLDGAATAVLGRGA